MACVRLASGVRHSVYTCVYVHIYIYIYVYIYEYLCMYIYIGLQAVDGLCALGVGVRHSAQSAFERSHSVARKSRGDAEKNKTVGVSA